MKVIIKGLLFLVAAAAVILLSDLPSAGKKNVTSATRIAVFKLASRPVLDETEKGFKEEMALNNITEENGFFFDYYCAEGDMPTAHTIASLIVDKKYDLVLSISTPSLQTMANANQRGVVTHVFCTVTDPFAAGVGITGTRPEDHPAWLTGIGTFQPVERAFEVAMQINPNLKRVGTVWCASEVCSEMCVLKARKFCADHNLELVEMVIDNSNMVVEATNALLMKEVDALWVGGDNVVELAIDQLIGAAKKVKVPVFTNAPNHAVKGALFGIGADYYNVGVAAGKMMAQIIHGTDPASFPIDNVVPEELVVNPNAAQWAGEEWRIPDVIINEAKNVVN